MQKYTNHPPASLLIIAVLAATVVGCEGIARKHDSRVGVDVQPPPMGGEGLVAAEDMPNIPDRVESMMAAREAYIKEMLALERGYLLLGDTVRANWARRQREVTEGNEVYPYLTDAAPEQRVVVAPEESIAEADKLYAEGLEVFESIQSLPLGAIIKQGSEDPRRAMRLFKRVLSEYPKSDKVDDAAFYCGEIYKEYLREDDPDNELAVRYFRWAFALDPTTPHPARFNCAVVYDYRLHNRAKAIELYHRVLETEEAGNNSNQRFAATRIEQLTDDEGSHLRPRDFATTVRPAAESRSEAITPSTAKLPEDESRRD
jgi:tetratricopeptide (TPR) repeat protein